MAIGDKVYIADKLTLDTVNNKIGSSGDADVTTVMGKLNNIENISGIVGLDGKKYYPIMQGTADALIKIIETLAQSGGSYSIAIDESYIYLADSAAKTVIKFNKSNMSKVSETVAQSGDSESIAIDDSYIYYADKTAKAVIKFNKSDMSMVSKTLVQSGESTSIAIDDSYIYYADKTAKTVVKFKKAEKTHYTLTGYEGE